MYQFNKKLEFIKATLNKIFNSDSLALSSIFIVLLLIINICWFYGMQSHTLMGDDLFNWNYYRETPHFVDAVVTNHEFEKYRPVFNVFEFSLFKLFSSSTLLFFWFNAIFNFVILTMLFFLIKKITRNNIIAFCFSLLYITSRFSYYNVLQITGFLEALSMFWLVLMLHAAMSYFIEKKVSWLYWLLLLNFFIVFTHERFIVLLPFIIAVIYLGPNTLKGLKQKWHLFAIAFFPLLFNIFLKKVVFGINFLEGTAGTAIKINLLTVANFIKDGFLNVVGFNIGPEYLGGITFSNLGVHLKIVSFLIFSISIYVFVASIVKWIRAGKIAVINNLKIFFIWILLLFPLLLSASITIRQEFRWLYAPYLIFLIYFVYLISINFKNKMKYSLLFIFICLNLYNNIEYKKYISNVFFVYSQKISDSFYDESIKQYGCENRNFIIEKFDSYGWVLPADLFLKPYSCNNGSIEYVDNVNNIDLNSIDKNKTSIYKLNWPEKKMDMVNLH